MNNQALLVNPFAKPLQDLLDEVEIYSNVERGSKLSFKRLGMLAHNGPFAAAGWEFRERKLGKSTKDY